MNQRAAERDQLERAAYNSGLPLSGYIARPRWRWAGVEEAEDRLRRARAELQEARERPVLAPAVEVEAEPHRVRVYTADEHLDRQRGSLPAGGAMQDPACYEAA